MNHAAKSARVSAAMGAGLWLAFLVVRTSDSAETEVINRGLLLGILVIVPLGFSLVPRGLNESLLFWAAVTGQPVAATASAISFLLSPGRPAAILALSWLLVTIVGAAYGFRRLIHRGPVYSRELCIDAGLIYLPVGAIWFIASRLGIQPMGFGDTVVLLTAMHFHFAGFAAPILAGLAGRCLSRSRAMEQAFAATALCIVGGTPLVAAGITLSPPVALAGTIIVSAGLLLLAVLVAGWVVRLLNSFVAQTLLVVSSLSSVAAMVLASLYAYSLVAKTVILDIPQMALSHGILNAFGFALCGLLGWTLVELSSQSSTEL